MLRCVSVRVSFTYALGKECEPAPAVCALLLFTCAGEECTGWARKNVGDGRPLHVPIEVSQLAAGARSRMGKGEQIYRIADGARG